MAEGYPLIWEMAYSGTISTWRTALSPSRRKKEIIQTNNLPKNEKIQRNNSAKFEKIQRNNLKSAGQIQLDFLISERAVRGE